VTVRPALLLALLFVARAFGADSILINNPSFQADVFPTFPGYLGGSNPATITGWAATGGAGINGSDLGAGVPFADNGAIPDNTRLAFIQGPGSLVQTLPGFEVGQRYWLQVFFNARNCCGDVPVVSVSLGGQALLTEQVLSPVGGTSQWYFVNLPWTATAASAQLVISTHGNAGGDATVVIDAVVAIKRDATQVVLANPSFEASGTGLAGSGYLTSIAGWTLASTGGQAAINASGGAFLDNGVVPDGRNVLVLQNAIVAQQTLAGMVPGQGYRLRLFYNGRNTGNDPHLNVSIDGQTALDAFVPPVGAGAPFNQLTYDFTASAATAVLALQNLGNGGDATVFIDNVSVVLNGPIADQALALPTPGGDPGPDSIVTFNEIHYHPAGNAPEWIELHNQMSIRVDVGGWKIAGGIDFTIPDGTTMQPGGCLVISATAGTPAGALGAFAGKLDNSGEELQLLTRFGRMMDRVDYGVGGEWTALPNGDGPSLAKRSVEMASDVATSWAASTAVGGTPGAVNFSAVPALPAAPAHVAGPVVINEIMFHHRPTYANPAANVAYAENLAEWIELHNWSDAPVDVSGWSLANAVSYTLPAGSVIEPGGFLVVDQAQFSGGLSNGGDRIQLRNASGTVVDDVHYRDGGRWAADADGGGSSLELIDPRADNSQPEAWAASDESGRSSWTTITYRGSGAEALGNNNPADWHEFLMGFIAPGEALIDDVSVLEDPDGAHVQCIQNGSFESDAPGATPAHWRILGTHRGVVEADGGGRVLHLVATDELEHTYNCASTTLIANRAIDATKTYEISYRAKWLAGSPQLSSRLYLNRAARTSILPQSALSGTPGAANSRRIANAGPTYEDLVHTPLVPAVNQSVTVSVRPQDPDGVAALTLFFSANGAAWQSVAMTSDAAGRWSGGIPGQFITNTVVQFYVRGVDSPGATTFFPAGGAASRACYVVGDGGVAGQPVRNKLRLVMTNADAAFLHNLVHAVSNARLGATVISNDREVFYNVGVRLRSAPFGRQGDRAGWNIEFDPTQPYRGTQQSIVIDGALVMPRGDGTGYLEVGTGVAVNEMLYHIAAQRAGGIPISYDDIVYFAARPQDGRRAQLRMARLNNSYLDSIIPNGGDGPLFKQEVIYYPTTTVDGNPESLKNPYNSFKDTEIRDMGATGDGYRFNYLPRNNRARDDFSRLAALGKAFSGPTASLYNATAPVMDFDEWMRVLAMNALCGVADVYNQSLAHNVFIYVRPSDQRTLLMPWDLDHTFYWATNFSILGGASHRVKDVIADPRNRRLYGGHLLDLCNTSFSNTYLDPWIDHLEQVAGLGYAANLKSYVSARRSFVMSSINGTWPAVTFIITTNGGANFSVSAPTALVTGNGWIDVRTIRNATTGQVFVPNWLNGTQWQIAVPLAFGANVVALQALNAQGSGVGSDTITITNTGSVEPASASNLVVSELMYHPTEPTAAEIAAGYLSADDFEFLELLNVGPRTVDLTGAQFTDGITFNFTGAAITSLPSGGRVLLVSNAAAFAYRYGAGKPVAGAYANNLSDTGERLLLVNSAGGTILDFSYRHDGSWPAEADGAGYALVLKRPGLDPGDPNSWRSSALPGGTPGGTDTIALGAYPTLLEYAFVSLPVSVPGTPYLTFSWRERIGADAVELIPEISSDLATWEADSGDHSLVFQVSAHANGDGSRTVTWQTTQPLSAALQRFARVKVQTVP
jgi:hypothetical protein